ncbi:hypothetical protein C8A01DRAFT_49673 [Parachaetomium inaequale]|uniref:F-box domain-containing protein n=1 Tax=Parachaetomium inaequale TaxID=2588326 RepID=A0AAN6P8Q2_9PEZI|nr:hypothetical protein C8A01DRAFT_49673 [Parachaetomium inaequale]
MDSHPTLDSLPNELLLSILSHLPTASLLPLITVSHRIYAATLRILKQRLNRATSQPDHRLMLECYHPAEKLYTPYLYCDYLSTDSFAGVEAEAEAEGAPSPQQHLGAAGLRGIYSHFRPMEHDDNPPRLRGRVSSSGGGSTRGGGGGGGGSGGQQPDAEQHPRPSIDVYLDDDESFSQLCTITNLVRMGPKPGLFRSHVNVGEGVVRVWRGWLAARAAAAAAAAAAAGGQVGTGAGGDGGGGGGGGGEETVLWADAARDVGVRFRVTEKDVPGHMQHPVLVASDEQLPVAYRLEFEELLVRSTTLLVMVEKSEVQEVAAEGRAIVLASF